MQRNLLYLASGISNRIIVLATVLIMAHLLPAISFGRYSLITSNALLIQIVAGGWLFSSVGKNLSTAKLGRRKALFSNIVASLGFIFAALFVLVLGYAVSPFPQIALEEFTIALGLAFSLIVYEVVQAAQNALDMHKRYAYVALARNLLILIFSAFAVIIGFNIYVVLAIQLLLNISPIAIAINDKNIKNNISRRLISGRLIFDDMKFGFSGSLLFGLYIMLGAIARNIIAGILGVELAGKFGLIMDLMFAPLVLASSALSLSTMPELYRAGKNLAQPEIRFHQVSKYLQRHLILIAGYILTAPIVIPIIFKMFLPDPMTDLSEYLIFELTIFCSIVIIMFSINTIFLTFNFLRALKLSIFSALVVQAAAFSLSLNFNFSLDRMLLVAAMGHLVIVVVSLIWLWIKVPPHGRPTANDQLGETSK